MKATPQIDDTQGKLLLRKLNVGRSIFALAYIGLLLLFTGLNLVRDGGGWSLWLVQVLPLAVFIPGLLRQYHRTYSWICFAILIYFTWSVTNVMSPWAHWSDGVILTLIVAIFISAMMVSRWLQYYGLYLHQVAERHAAEQLPPVSQ